MTTQCDAARDTDGERCIHVVGHRCAHRFAEPGEGDLSDEIRLQFAKDVRDRECESLLAQLSAFRAALGEMTAARDEACDRLEAAWNRLYLKSEMAEVGDGGVASLRSVGRAK